jgi:hypothetical protein
MIDYLIKSDGFITKAGQLVDYVEWHTLAKGAMLPFIAVSMYYWFDIRFLLLVDALMVTLAVGFDIVGSQMSEMLQRIRKENHYFLTGHIPVIIGLGIWKTGLTVFPLVLNLCL